MWCSEAVENNHVVHYLYKYMPNFGGWGNILSTPGIVNNTWIKMRELSLTYDFPRKWLDKQNLFKQASISLVGRDLFYFYKTLPDNINPSISTRPCLTISTPKAPKAQATPKASSMPPTLVLAHLW